MVFEDNEFDGLHPPTKLPSEISEDSLNERIRVLSSEVWEHTVKGEDVRRWLGNFTGAALNVDAERLHALYMLANFDYFGLREVRELLRCVYRDLFRYPIIQSMRKELAGTRDPKLLEPAFQSELASTRFLGMGNPSESGAHLLYYFRQTNRLPKSQFIHEHEILEQAIGIRPNKFAISGLRRIVFIDDLMGSGDQAITYSQKVISHLRDVAADEGVEIQLCYFTLFASQEALDRVRSLPFDSVEAVHIIGDSERAFSETSRLYAPPPEGIDPEDARSMAETYGKQLAPGFPLGWRDGQLLLGLHHNVPDNSLPIFWLHEDWSSWEPVFPRFQKM